MIAFKISVTDAIMSYTGVYSTYISHDPILGQLKPFAKTVIETVFGILIIKYILVSHIMHEFKKNKLLKPKRPNSQIKFNYKANKSINKNINYGHIVQKNQSVSVLTFTKTVRIIQNNMFYKSNLNLHQVQCTCQSKMDLTSH